MLQKKSHFAFGHVCVAEFFFIPVVSKDLLACYACLWLSLLCLLCLVYTTPGCHLLVSNPYVDHVDVHTIRLFGS